MKYVAQLVGGLMLVGVFAYGVLALIRERHRRRSIGQDQPDRKKK